MVPVEMADRTVPTVEESTQDPDVVAHARMVNDADPADYVVMLRHATKLYNNDLLGFSTTVRVSDTTFQPMCKQCRISEHVIAK